MRLTPLKIFAAAAVLSAISTVAVSSRAAGDKTLAQLACYRGWSRVTPEPVSVNANAALGG